MEIKQLPNKNEVELLLPTTTSILDYRFEEIKLSINNKQKEFKKIVREIKICFSAIESNKWRYQLLCVNLEVDSNYLSTVNATILRQQLTIFNEITVYVNQRGSIIKIINIHDLQQRWKETKAELIENNQGAVFEDFIADNDQFFNDEEKILNFVTSKEMYGLYFNDCWGYHDIKKPRYKGLEITLKEPRISYDYHTRHLIVPYNQDLTMTLNIQKEQKTQQCEMLYVKHQLEEVHLEIEEPNTQSNYSLLWLTT